MAPDEVLAGVKVATAAAQENALVYKISRRFDGDISAVCLEINLRTDGGLIAHAFIGVGAVTATPVRAVHADAALECPVSKVRCGLRHSM